ncbi:MAG: hypothetical protein V1646_02260 [bacterium]
MKKLLAVAIVSIVSFSCMAGSHSRTISINNDTDVTVEVRDSDNHTLSVEPHRSASLVIIVSEPHGSFPVPSFLMPHVTTITVTDDNGSNSIKIDENTKSVTISEGLKLTLDSDEKQDSNDTTD